MVERDVSVINSLGIHARPASMIVQAASDFDADIELLKDGIAADAKSILNVMMLAASKNSTVTIRATGSDEEKALAALAKLFEEGFGEE